MRWNKPKNQNVYKSGRFKIFHNTKAAPNTWEVYADGKYLGYSYTLRNAKTIAEDYALGL